MSFVKILLPSWKCSYDLVDSLPQKLKNGKQGATRTKCEDRDSLRTVLFWFTMNNLTKMDERYINSDKWEMTHHSDGWSNLYDAPSIDWLGSCYTIGKIRQCTHSFVRKHHCHWN